jgi:type II secretion system protein J
MKLRTPRSIARRTVRFNSPAFTLIELVISVSLMTLILVSAYMCLSAGISTQKLIDPRVEILQNARVAMALMTADLRAACPLAKDFDFLGMHRRVDDAEADNLDFATHNYMPRRVREGDFCQVSYFLAKDSETGSFNLWRRRNPTIGIDPLSGGVREEIAKGVTGLRLEYYDGFEWFETWGDVEGKGKAQNRLLDLGNLTGMPEAVRITLWLAPNHRASKDGTAKKETAEPPMMFQTVARLNLAATAQTAPTGSSSTNAADSATSQATPNPFEGGNP